MSTVQDKGKVGLWGGLCGTTTPDVVVLVIRFPTPKITADMAD
jgi:hypothetical protein